MVKPIEELDYKEESQWKDFEQVRKADLEIESEISFESESQNSSYEFLDEASTVLSLTKKNNSKKQIKPLNSLNSSQKRPFNATIQENESNGIVDSNKRLKLPKSLYKCNQIHHTSQGQADYFRQHFEFAVNEKIYFKNEIFYPLPASRFIDISSLPSFTDESLSSLPSKLIPNLSSYFFNEKASSDCISKSKLRKGGPLLWVICMSGLRCMDVYRELKKSGPLKCGKFFAKHMKLEEQISFLKNTAIHVAIGTPARMLQLMPYFSTLNLHAIVMDASYKNRIQQSLLTSPDSRDAFFQFYFQYLHKLCQGKEKEKVDSSIPLSLDQFPQEWSKKQKKRELKKLVEERKKLLESKDTKLCLF